jgi:2-keto-4-pentenoate hydratase/2-oxohepta-3-ene-1,7-dioic acid hydratase in catechol pathway
MGDLLEIIRGGDVTLAQVRVVLAGRKEQSHALSEVRLMAPVIAPSKIVAIGLNYLDHCKEANLPVPPEPVVFSKFPTSVTGPYDEITWPRAGFERSRLRGRARGS